MAYHSIQYIALGSTRLVDVFCNLPALAVCWKSLLTAVAAEIFRLYTAQLLNCLNVVSSLELSVPSFSSVLLDMTDGSYFGLLRPRRKYNKKRTAWIVSFNCIRIAQFSCRKAILSSLIVFRLEYSVAYTWKGLTVHVYAAAQRQICLRYVIEFRQRASDDATYCRWLLLPRNSACSRVASHRINHAGACSREGNSCMDAWSTCDTAFGVNTLCSLITVMLDVPPVAIETITFLAEYSLFW